MPETLPITLASQEIMNLIPHRAPFIFIDSVTIISPTEIKGQKNVTINEPYFPGHFPGNPIVPGVIILESMAQTAGILVLYSLDNNPEFAAKAGIEKGNGLRDLYFVSVDNANFRIPVVPGDVVLIEIKILATRGKVCKFSATAKVKEKTVADAKFTAAVVQRNKK